MSTALKSIDHLSADERAFAAEIKSAIRRVEPDATVILFGSRARGDAGAESDWDVLVLVDEPVTFELRSSIRQELMSVETDHEQLVSLVIREKASWYKVRSPFSLEVREEGVNI